MHLDGPVGALLGTALAADAPVFDDDLTLVAAMNRADRAADHAHRVQAGAAGGGHEVLFDARPFEKEPALAVVMGADAGLHALVAARAALQVHEHQLLALDQAELVGALGMEQARAGCQSRSFQGLPSLSGALGNHLGHLLPQQRDRRVHLIEQLFADANELYRTDFAFRIIVGMIVGQAGGHARAVFQHPHLAEKFPARTVSQDRGRTAGLLGLSQPAREHDFQEQAIAGPAEARE